MITVRQIERSWSAKQYDRLVRELFTGRSEETGPLLLETGGAPAAAAMAIIRLDELSQSHVPLYSQLIRTVLAAQEADGGWGDPAMTALCLRALFCGHGHGVAIDHGVRYLARMQKAEGLWPREPLRRMPADPLTSAFVLYELADHAEFQAAVQLGSALEWFEKNQAWLDVESRRLWERAKARCRPVQTPSPTRKLPWSPAHAA
jgi:hypothetical protein